MLAKFSCFATSIALGFCFFASSPATAQTEVLSPDQLVQMATQAADKGSFSQSLDLARQARSAAGGDLAFDVRYISANVDIAAKADARHRVSLLNEAIKAANNLEKSKYCDGKGNPEIAWHYMVVMGKLGSAIEGKHGRIASQIFLAQFRVASNLKTNPAFPPESISLLGNHMIGGAKAWAIKKDEAKTLAALQTAVDGGFNDFDSILESKTFEALGSKKVTAAIAKNFAKYKTNLAKWARESVAGFNSFEFRYDVASVHGGHVSSTELRGKIVVLDLWATWCQPCLESLPHFVRLHKEMGKSSNVEVLGVSMDDPDAPHEAFGKVRKFTDDRNLQYEMGMGTRSMMNQLNPDQKLPSVLFIDATGQVRYIAQGPHNFYQLAALTNELIRQQDSGATSFEDWAIR